MMKRKTTIILLLFILLTIPLWGENYLHHRIYATILVADPEVTAGKVVSWAEEAGGYFLYNSPDHVTIRFPVDRTGSFRPFLEDSSEYLFEYSSEAQDFREEIVLLQSGIRSREEILEKNLSYIDKADVQGTLEIEREVMHLLTEIEGLKGRLNRLLQDIRYSYAEVALSFQNTSIPRTLSSSFNWINSVDFYSFVEGYYPSVDSAGGKPRVEIPKGLAEMDTGRDFFSAISPEGLILRIRTVVNYPEKDIDFWTAALGKHLTGVGYYPAGEKKTFDSPAGEGGYFEWGLPYIGEDYLYLTAACVKGKKILILEAAGEQSVYSQYREALIESLNSAELK
jgi:hypothetical protein